MIIIYDKNTGEIKQSMSVPPKYENDNEYLETISDGNGYIVTDQQSLKKKYIDVLTKEIIDFKDMSLSINKTEFNSDGVDTLEITNIPSGTSVKLRVSDFNDFVIDDGEFIFTTEKAGRYDIILLHPHYQTVKIKADAI